MTCHACTTPNSGVGMLGFRQCQLREIARGPAFFASMLAGKLTPAYAAQCEALGQVKAVHAEVKAVSKTLHMGSLGA